MRKLVRAGYCLAVMLGLNCAITNYPIITDNDQVSGGKAAGVQPVVDTRGKAHIRAGQLVTVWPDGTDELIHFIDQRADGTAKLTTYNNFSSGGEPVLHDDLYCDTDREGCALFTAPDDNSCPTTFVNFDLFPTTGTSTCFDGEFNAGCSGARSLSILVSSARYYGECGRLRPYNRKLALEDKLALFNAGAFANRLGRQGLLYKWNAGSVSVSLTNQRGETFSMPLRGAGDLWISAQDDLGVLDLRNSLVSSSLAWYAEFLKTHATEATAVTVTYNGISVPFMIAGQHPAIDGDTVLGIRNRAY